MLFIYFQEEAIFFFEWMGAIRGKTNNIYTKGHAATLNLLLYWFALPAKDAFECLNISRELQHTSLKQMGWLECTIWQPSPGVMFGRAICQHYIRDG